MRFGANYDLRGLVVMAVRENGRQICHGPRRTKQCPFFAEQIRRELFQGIYGRVLSHD